jgi:hypothetical protein
LEELERRWLPTVTVSCLVLTGGAEGASAATVASIDVEDRLPFQFSAALMVTVDWGDMTPTTTITTPVFDAVQCADDNSQFCIEARLPLGSDTAWASHVYSEEGSYTVTVTVSDPTNGGSAFTSGTLTIVDTALSGESAGLIRPIVGQEFSGVVASFIDENPSGVKADMSATIDWGDGVTTDGAISRPPCPTTTANEFWVSGTHTYSADVMEDMKVKVTDEGGVMTTLPGTALVSKPSSNVLVNNEGEDFGDIFHRTQSETSVALAGTNVVVAYNDLCHTCMGHFTGYSTSIDGGTTFTDQGDLPSGGNDHGDPILAYDNQAGTLYLATLSIEKVQPDIQLFSSTDGGETFSPPTNAAGDGKFAGDFLDKPWMTVDNSTAAGAGRGYIYLTFTDVVGGPKGGFGTFVFLKFSTNGGKTWTLGNGGMPVNAGSSAQGSQVVVGKDHSVYVFWLDHTPDANGKDQDRILMQKFVVQVAADGSVTLAPSLSIVVVQKLNVTTPAGDLGLFALSPAGGFIPFRTNAFPAIAINPMSGALYVAYDDATGTADKADIFFTYSKDGSDGSWSAPVRVNDDMTTTDQWQPAITVTPDGSKLGIFWYDRRNDPLDQNIDRYGVIGTITDTGAVTLGTNFRVTDVNFLPQPIPDSSGGPAYLGDYDTAAADSKFFYTTWGDSRFSEQGSDVRFMKIPVAGPSNDLSAAGIDISPTEGMSFSGTVASFSDLDQSGSAADYTATITWGDSSVSVGTVSGSGGSFTVSGAHTYTEESALTFFPVSVAIADNSDGSSATATSKATVADAALTALGTTVNLTATEGLLLSETIATFSDANPNPDIADFTATIDWGDETTSTGIITPDGANFDVSRTHTYKDEGTFTIQIDITDKGGSSVTALRTAIVAEADALTAVGTDVAPTEGQAFTGQVATFTDTNVNADAGDFPVTIDWGDLSTSAGTVAGANGSFTISGTHTYTDEGNFAIGISIVDDAPGTASAVTTATANVAEYDVLVTTATGIAPQTEGVEFSSEVATFTDTKVNNTATDFTATIDWADGTTTVGTIAGANGAFTVSGDHSFSDEGKFFVSVQVSDDDPGSATSTAGSLTVVAENDVLAVTANDLTATEGISDTGLAATFTDTNLQNTAGDFTATIYWGDRSSSIGTVAGSGGYFTVTGTHTYMDEGKFAVSVTVKDDDFGTDGATGESMAMVAENDVLTARGIDVAMPETKFFLGSVAAFGDSNTANVAGDFSASIDWGDGTTDTGTIDGSDGSFSVEGGHTYTDEGTFTINVIVMDDDPGTALAEVRSKATVAEDDALTVTANNIASNEGVPFAGVVATFTDTNVQNGSGDFTATITWGDGTSAEGTVAGGNGAFTVTAAHNYIDEDVFDFQVTVVDDGPGTATGTANAVATIAETDALTGSSTDLIVTELVPFSGVVATFTDANVLNIPGDFTATITWGDGGTSAGTVAAVAPGVYDVSGTHTYGDEGAFTVSVTLSDDSPGFAGASTIFTVIAFEGDILSATAPNLTSSEGTPFSRTVATFTDISKGNIASDFSATVAWGDGTSSAGVITGSAGSFTVKGSHTYADEGSFPVRVTILDDFPGTASATATSTATIADRDALTAAGVKFKATAGSLFTGTVATFSDTYTGNVPGDFTAAINWGDGTATSSGMVTGSGGSFSVAGRHTYTATGKFTVTVTIADAGGASASGAGEAMVSKPKPHVAQAHEGIILAMVNIAAPAYGVESHDSLGQREARHAGVDWFARAKYISAAFESAAGPETDSKLLKVSEISPEFIRGHFQTAHDEDIALLQAKVALDFRARLDVLEGVFQHRFW